jgi:hypothetical protein
MLHHHTIRVMKTGLQVCLPICISLLYHKRPHCVVTNNVTPIFMSTDLTSTRHLFCCSASTFHKPEDLKSLQHTHVRTLPGPFRSSLPCSRCASSAGSPSRCSVHLGTKRVARTPHIAPLSRWQRHVAVPSAAPFAQRLRWRSTHEIFV